MKTNTTPHARRIHTIIIFALVISVIGTALSARPVHGAVILVTSAEDNIIEDESCTLREAIINANQGNQTHSDCISGTSGQDTITFADDVKMITLGHQVLPPITTNIVITGHGRTSSIIQASTCNPVENECSHNNVVFSVRETGDLTLNKLTVRHGNFSFSNPIEDIISNWGVGGGINNLGNLIINNSKISDNRGDVGGGISNLGKLLIKNSEISNNKAFIGGGIINGGAMLLTGSTVSNNSAIFMAGGLANSVFILSINGADFPPGLDDAHTSESIHVAAKISESKIYSNESQSEAGGLINGGWVSVFVSNLSGEPTKIERSYAEESRSIDTKLDYQGTRAMLLEDSTISYNRAFSGGGISNEDIMVVNATTISSNHAQNDGGGILNRWFGTMILTNNTVSGNTANHQGGGIYHHSFTILEMVNNTLSGNAARGIYTQLPNLLANMSKPEPLPDDSINPVGGLFINWQINLASENTSLLPQPFFLKLTNNIVANSTGDDCAILGDGIVTNKNNLVEDGSCEAFLTGDPWLQPLSNNGGSTLTHDLMAPSPAIDKGDISACLLSSMDGVDQRGTKRPQGDRCDIGAVEYIKPTVLPETGFAMGRITPLPVQPGSKAYSDNDLILEIPTLGEDMSIVGVPQRQGAWDVTWLGDRAGYLYGSAFPTWVGNTVITGHAWDADNSPGVFADLKTLGYGDKILIHAFGQTYIYEVRENKLVRDGGIADVFQSETYDWVTLVTCEFFNPLTDSFAFRRVVRAVLVQITE